MYRRDDPFSVESETRLKRGLNYADLTGSEWAYNELGTAEEEHDILNWFMNSFTQMFPSFQRPADELWIRIGYIPVIPPKSNLKNPWDYDKYLYKQRNQVERLFRRIKRFHRIFTRYDKLDVIF